MFRKAYILLVIVLIPFLNHAQGAGEKSAQKELSKQRWGKAYNSLRKSLDKNPGSVPAYYLLSIYYFSEQNPAFQVDSAYRYVQESIRRWSAADSRARGHWSRLPLDSAMLYNLRSRVDSAAFEQARKLNTEAAYSSFIEHHPDAKQYQTAVELRFAVAYENAVATNTFQSFQTFITNYPDAPQVTEAKSKYDELLFLHSTRDNRPESFEAFLRDNPGSRFRPVAEQRIFEASTANGRPASFLEFLKKYPASSMKKRAIDILYHLLHERNESLPEEIRTDSINGLAAMERDYLVPVLVKEKFGLMNSTGKIVLQPEYDEIDDVYLCGDISEDLIVLPGRLVDRRGETVMTGTITRIEDEGYGYMRIQVDGKNIIYHKGGFRFGDLAVDDFKVLNGRLLSVRSGGKWGVLTLAGRRLIPFEYDDIDNIGDLLVFKQGKRFKLSGIDTIASIARGNEPYFAGEFDEVKKMGTGVIVRQDQLTGAFDQKLVGFIPLGQHVITPVFFGSVVNSPQGNVIYNRFGEASENFAHVSVLDPWVTGRSSEGWVLYNPDVRIYKSIPYDTINLYGPYAVGKKNGGYEINLFAKPDKLVTINDADHFEFLPGRDSVSYLVVVKGTKRSVYDPAGDLLFTLSTVYDKIETAGSGHFIVTRKEKKGLLDRNGKVVVPLQYEAVGTAAGGLISLLKGGRFGAYDVSDKLLFPATYEKNLQRFDKNYLIAFKEGAYGFIDKKNKPLTGFTFSEVMPWKDSVALVRENSQYKFMNVYTRKSEVEGVSRWRRIKDGPDEKLYIVFRDNNYGVISNRAGLVIPINFSDIVNVGSAEVPMYFTEKHVAEASIFVVIYYDHKGRMIRREVYEQEQYERIYCDGK